MIAEDRDGQLIIRSFALKGMRDLLEPTEEVPQRARARPPQFT